MSEFSKILVVDDEDVIRQTLQDMLEDLGYEVLEADNGKSAISIIADEKPALVITDLRMPEMSGIELIQHCQQHYPDLLTVVISSVSQIGDAIDAMRLGAFDYLVKPLKGFDVLEKTINKALKKYAETKSLASQQLQKEQEIRRQVKAIEQEFLYSVINAISDPIYVKNDTAQCIVVNDAMCAWIGKSRDDLLGHTDEAFFLDDTRSQLEQLDSQVFANGLPSSNETKIVLNDKVLDVVVSKSIFVDPRTAEKKIVTVFRDITLHKLNEKIINRTQKMDALGQLTGGIAHDFNNLIGIITGQVSLMKPVVHNDYKLQKRVNSIEKSAYKAADLTTKLLNFAKREKLDALPTNLNSTIENIRELLDRAVTAQIQIEYHLEPDLWVTEANISEFEDVLMNLVLNARDAMPSGGNLVVETHNVVLDEAYCNQVSEISAGEYVQVVITDSGHGISKQNLERIFEPFFSTKANEQGTGLGLAMVFGFVKRSQGFINVYSEEGMGTTFRVYLPRSNKLAIKPEITMVEHSDTLPRGTEKILVVDDEEDLLEIARDGLEMLGYQVLVADSGDKALNTIMKNDDIALLCTDIMMPGELNGYQLVEKVMRIKPEIAIMLTSGYAEKALENSRLDISNEQILNKPYTHQMLAEKVSHVLITTRKKRQLNQGNETQAIPVEWQTRYSLGIGEMDSEHQSLFKQLHQCQLLVFQAQLDELAVNFDRLNTLVLGHFRHEEQLMESIGYPGLANHRKVHSKLIRMLNEHYEQYCRDEVSANDFVHFLETWLVEHIETMDKAYVPYYDQSLNQ